MTDKPVLFASMRPFERSENIMAIYNAYDGAKVHMHMADPLYRGEVLSGKYDVMVIDDFPQISTSKCIMIWHAIQGGKKIGLDQPGRPYYDGKMADNITYIISAGAGMIPIWSGCSGVAYSHVLPLGMPRTDEYTGYKDEPSDKKTYLFVPTFRDKGETPFPTIDWEYIDSQLTDDEVFVVKAHPWQAYVGTDQVTGGIVNGMYKHIVIISPATITASWLYLADVVITDYSSVMFDAYLLKKPVVLFEKTKGYTETRGMYFDYPMDYCSYFAQNEEQLLNNIRFRAKYPYLTPTEERITNIVADKCDGHSCERICDLINSIK